MKAIEPSLVKDNFIEIIGKEWMLVSAGDKDKFNMMTASWGGVGFLWNKPVGTGYRQGGSDRFDALFYRSG